MEQAEDSFRNNHCLYAQIDCNAIKHKHILKSSSDKNMVPLPQFRFADIALGRKA